MIGQYIDLIPTPNPNEMAFRVKVKASEFQPTTLPEIGTTYAKSSFLKTKPRAQFEGFSEYQLVYISRGDEFIWFHYGKPKTDAERNTPFRSFHTTRRFTWPAVLEDLYAIKTTDFVQAVYNGTDTQTEPSYFDRYSYRPAVSVASIALVEQFLAPTPWPKAVFVHPQIVPTDVQASWVGLRFHFPDCLHPEIKITEQVPGASVVLGVGVVSPTVPRNFNVKFFPATSMLDWPAFYVLDHDQEPVEGMYLRIKITIYPPPRPEPITF